MRQLGVGTEYERGRGGGISWGFLWTFFSLSKIYTIFLEMLEPKKGRNHKKEKRKRKKDKVWPIRWEEEAITRHHDEVS
jgi:hypothetical protein